MTKVWLVTGSSRGLGRAVAREVLAAGHDVVATARDVRALDDLRAEYPDHLLVQPLDVTDPQQAQAAVDAAVARFGRLDVVVNNAGYANMATIEEVELDDFRAQVEAVFYGTVHVTKAALPVLLRQGAGHFIQVTSIGGRDTSPGVSAYQSAKFAVEGFSGVLEKEVSPLGIKVTIAEPGLMRTDWSGASMVVHPYSAKYEPTMGPLVKYLSDMQGREPIDPARIARVFLDVVEMEQPPLHLVLGRGAVDMIAQSTSRLAEEDARWAELGRSVDFDDAA
ncbi:SDR family NAD(P)-dependent oxidoreductase [Micromonospora sp. WMMD961]|uniref:SDR family NAD(P)-dependent oxidoreductase n=1 Tax=Micromonospora sp. WMMD961 TaxID=3016100 RepID=UPI00241658BB|nr:SDR family NAD(P)-dependent oxidoreductase [Micromonospora sp. WMMD961]MDG4783540.1 SDR family NAD(P)-dependent oxidoreductase [Micromonospora sp. WMMD961]